MLVRHFVFGLCFGFLGMGVSACSPASPQEPAGAAVGYTQTPLPPGEVIHISGVGPFVSEPFSLEGSGRIELFWQQDCQVFYLQLVNADETLAKAPNGTIIFESAASPTGNTESDDFRIPFDYIPGEYVIQIDAEGGQWEVWARVETSNEGE